MKQKVYEYEKGKNGTARKTFQECFDICVAEKLEYVKDPEKILSVKNTIEKLRSDYKRFFTDSKFENLYIDEITGKDIENICLANLQKKDLNKKAFLSLRGIIKNVCMLAMAQYWISDNPYLHADFTKFKHMTVESAPVEDRVHTDDEIKKMLDYIHNHQAKYPKYLPSYALELQIAMGLRRGEIPPLEWNDVKVDEIQINKQQVTVKKSLDNPKEYFKVVYHTKTWRNRKFPLTEPVESILKRLRMAQKAAGIDSPYLFPAKTETGVITNNTVYNFYRRMCKALGIKIDRNFIKGTHSFRRNGITRVINNTGNVVIAAEIFGNSPEVALQNYFTESPKDLKKKALAP